MFQRQPRRHLVLNWAKFSKGFFGDWRNRRYLTVLLIPPWLLMVHGLEMALIFLRINFWPSKGGVVRWLRVTPKWSAKQTIILGWFYVSMSTQALPSTELVGIYHKFFGNLWDRTNLQVLLIPPGPLMFFGAVIVLIFFRNYSDC
jgi:hypothetical protein